MNRINLIKIVVVLGLVIACVGNLSGTAQAADAIGQIKTLEGEASIVRGGETIAVKVGDKVFAEDIVQTGADSALGITFADNSRTSVGADTALTLDEFVYSGNKEKGSFVMRLVKGTLFYVSGFIAKVSPESVNIVTPDATIGIRGTRLLVKVVDIDA